MKRKIEIFTAGCPVCDEQVQKIKELACSCCDIEVLNVNQSPNALNRSKSFGIKRLPSVVIDGVLAECCSGNIDFEQLKSMGLGKQM
ncbi:MAG: thioredoxin family protein [Chlorobi bacterium]|nr:thioredoxin family protein [Chlorobiota bacterium]MCI0717190.1 thioredoxin family protein [Chlorobiota bacterium]